MHANDPFGFLYSFLLALARVAGVISFLPMPGLRNAPDLARVILALSITLCLSGAWPAAPATAPGMITLTVWMASEAAFGLFLGLFLSVVVESFQLGAQILGLQAGFSYASTIDPNSQADATVLQVFTQLLSGILVFTLGLHREIIRLLANSFQAIPPGTFAPRLETADALIHFSSTLFSAGLRLAFPVIALLLLVDLALALMSRMQSQLQLLTLAFPVKMVAAIGFLGATLWVIPSFTQTEFHKTIAEATRMLGR